MENIEGLSDLMYRFKYCTYCGKSHDMPITWQDVEKPDMEKYSFCDYADEDYCTVTTEEIDSEDLLCTEEPIFELPPWCEQEIQERKDIEKLRELSRNKRKFQE